MTKNKQLECIINIMIHLSLYKKYLKIDFNFQLLIKMNF